MYPHTILFKNFLNENNIDFDINTNTDEINPAEIPIQILQAYGGWLYDKIITKNLSEIPHAYYPTWFFFEKPEMLSDSWLIHFTHDNAYDIKNKGFIYGYPDYKYLGLTTQIQEYNPSEKYAKSDNYNFAYSINDYLNYINDNEIPASKYGYDFVVFKSNGVRAWHNMDNEYQVIFSGKDVHDITPAIVNQNDDGYVVLNELNKIIYESNTVSGVVNWVVN